MAQPLEIQYRQLAELIPYARNSRTHSDEQIGQIAGSIKEFGFTNPVLIDEDGGIIAGHGRVMAAGRLKLDEVPTITLRGLTEAQKRAYIIADNRLPLNAGWDFEMLAVELDELRDQDFDISLLGFSAQELNDLIGTANLPPGDGAGGDEDETPEVDEIEISMPGEVWQLGPHRVMCGDSTSAADVAKLCNGIRAHLIHADPPYGMGKEADGVVNDNLYGDQLDAFQMGWWKAFRAHVQPNASAYIWGNAPDLWRLWWRGGLADSEPMTLRNEIVWDKTSGHGKRDPDKRMFTTGSERCLFFVIASSVVAMNQTVDDYWSGWDSIRVWLGEQRDLAGWAAKDVNRICGTSMHGHWFTKSQWVLIGREHYEKLSQAANGKAFIRPYEDIEAEHLKLKAVFDGHADESERDKHEAGRPYFDNTHEPMYDVWQFPVVVGDERHGHATPKPVAMMERVMKSSTREGETVLEPFGGSGSTLMGAEKTGRACFSMELQPKYVDVIVRRWQNFTGKKATLDGDGRTFDDIAAERSGSGNNASD